MKMYYKKLSILWGIVGLFSLPIIAVEGDNFKAAKHKARTAATQAAVAENQGLYRLVDQIKEAQKDGMLCPVAARAGRLLINLPDKGFYSREWLAGKCRRYFLGYNDEGKDSEGVIHGWAYAAVVAIDKANYKQLVEDKDSLWALLSQNGRRKGAKFTYKGEEITAD